MEDFNALAAALGADLDGVRASLILSRDGLLIGAHPADAEEAAKPAWIRVATLGDPERGFFQFATETWCYVRRGPYSAFVVATTAVRPGLLIDQMERVLLAAEEGRADRSALKTETQPVPAVAPSSKPRTPLHPEPAKADDEPVVIHAAAEATAETAGAAAAAPATDETQAPDGGAETPPAAPKTGRQSIWATDGSEEDLDSFSLAREFGQLLQDGEQGADG